MVLIHAQLTGATSLRALEAGWNANAHAHYHLRCEAVARSTIADANARRPVEAFAEVLTMVAGLTDRSTRTEARKMLRLIELDAHPVGTTVRLGQVERPHSRHEGPCRLRSGLRSAAHPRHHRRQRQRRPNRPTDRDRGRPHLRLRQGLLPLRLVESHSRGRGLLRHEAQDQHGPDRQGRAPIWALARRRLHCVSDEEVELSSKGDSKLPIPLRRIEILRDEDAKTIIVITNDMKRSAVEIAQVYKFRWQIELLFRWLKQHLKLRSFLGTSPNAVKLQIYAAMIAYILLRLAAKAAKPNSTSSASPNSSATSSSPAAASEPSTHPHRSIPAANATDPTPTRWPSAMRKTSPDSRALGPNGYPSAPVGRLELAHQRTEVALLGIV